jgi:S-DNA-T family DNA segregation ATPase FtsK/SpoIIIE
MKKGKRVNIDYMYTYVFIILFMLVFTFFLFIKTMDYIGVYKLGYKWFYSVVQETIYKQFLFRYIILEWIYLILFILFVVWLVGNKKAVINRKLVSFIKNNNYIIYENVNGKKKIKNKLEVYYNYIKKDDYLIITIKVNGSPFDKDIKNNGREKIEDLFNTSLSAMNMDFGFISYEVAFNTNDRLKELIYTSEAVKLDKKKVWNYDYLPHGLIAGTTGTGKTYFLNYLICNLLYQKCCITFIDPKMADVRAIGNIVNPSKTGSTEDEIYKLVRDFKNSMEERQQIIAQAKRTNITYKDCGLNAEFLIFDELAAFKSGGVEKNSKDKIKQVEADLRKIILMGRSTGNFVILVAQQPNADVIETGIRDQLGLKVAFGNTKEELRRMLFGTDIKLHILDTRIKGVGYLSLGNGEPYKYYAPDLSAGFDYVGEIKRLMI